MCVWGSGRWALGASLPRAVKELSEAPHTLDETAALPAPAVLTALYSNVY